MKTEYWIVAAIVTFLVVGCISATMGYNHGYELGLLEGTEGVQSQQVLVPPVWIEPEETSWERELLESFSQVDSANITIHIEADGTEADFHISWDR